MRAKRAWRYTFILTCNNFPSTAHPSLMPSFRPFPLRPSLSQHELIQSDYLTHLPSALAPHPSPFHIDTYIYQVMLFYLFFSSSHCHPQIRRCCNQIQQSPVSLNVAAKEKKDTGSVYSKALYQHITLQISLMETEAQFGLQYRVSGENAVCCLCTISNKICRSCGHNLTDCSAPGSNTCEILTMKESIYSFICASFDL